MRMFQLPGAGDKEVLYGNSYGGGNVLCCVALGLPRSIFVPDVKLLFFQKPCRIARTLDFFEGFSEPQLIITTHKNPNSVLASQCSSSCSKSGGRRRFTALSPAALVRSQRERAALLPGLLRCGIRGSP